ncbi:hypothetical protein FHG87_019481 [Trinorchestia longiramus]|nr:hypothetical protein FHG87_019481 [Trinorchestia longiramus]
MQQLQDSRCMQNVVKTRKQTEQISPPATNDSVRTSTLYKTAKILKHHQYWTITIKMRSLVAVLLLSVGLAAALPSPNPDPLLGDLLGGVLGSGGGGGLLSGVLGGDGGLLGGVLGGDGGLLGGVLGGDGGLLGGVLGGDGLLGGVLGGDGLVGGLLNGLLGGASGGLLGGLLGGSEGSGGQNLLSVVNGLVKCLVDGLGVENVIDLVLNLAVTVGIPINFEAISALLEEAAQIQANVSVGTGSSPMGGTDSTMEVSSLMGADTAEMPLNFVDIISSLQEAAQNQAYVSVGTGGSPTGSTMGGAMTG